MPTVSIIDDDSEMLDTLARVVRRGGLQTQTFASAPAFLARSDHSRIDCLLVDLNATEPSDIEWLEKLGAGGFIYPVFVLSVFPKASDIAGIKALGAVVVGKPFHARALIQQICTAVEKSQN